MSEQILLFEAEELIDYRKYRIFGLLSGFYATVMKLGWTKEEYICYKRYTDYFNGGDVIHIPIELTENYERDVKELTEKNDKIREHIRKTYGD